ncbi:MAG: glycoside hydrolase family 3 C-terminal domain-containing protein [Clostridia bacterium]|nr:glycoside hydrolase family 3 C-terminal domain-containing protein [Clostridia bacterium]
MADDDVEESSSGYAHYYSDYNSLEEAAAAQEQINKSVAEEGIVLLKNEEQPNGDNALPIAKNARISVLGVAQDCLCETTGSITQSLRDAGFTNINPTLESLYLNDGLTNSSYGNETILNGTQESSIKAYSDVAVVVIARGGAGESSDRSLNTGEVDDDTYLGESQGWSHLAHQNNATEDEDETDSGIATAAAEATEEYKHELQLSDSEEYLIKLAEDNCNKVVVLYSSANQFEMYNLKNDDKIDAILSIGRLGNGGIDAVGEILSGEVNPSGKTVDEWTRDFTNDPTYANALASTYGEGAGNSGSSIASSGLVGYDYEEDIYLGYKFYETFWKEANDSNALLSTSNDGEGNPYYTESGADDWYNDNVVYPFGYGLSYADFDIEIESVTTNNNTSLAINSGASTPTSISATDLSSSVGSPASITSMTAKVKVTNKATSEYSGKETVQIYVNAPYGDKATTEKSYLTMVGFGKTDTLKPGKSQEIEITFNVQDFASWDSTAADGTGAYVLDQGTYNIYAMESSSHNDIDNENAVAAFSISDQAVLQLDDFSGNEVSNKFSAVYANDESEVATVDDVQSETTEETTAKQTNEYYSMLVGEETSMEVVMSRANFDETMPTAPTTEQMCSLTEETEALMSKYEVGDNGWTVDDEGQPWEQTSVPADWTQGDSKGIMLNDMVGVPLYENGEISSSWVTFINQLTWDEMGSLLNNGSHITGAIDSIGKLETEDENGPNYAVSDSYCWAGTPVQASTWNTELMAQFGRVVANMMLWQGRTGFYGPGCNIHRSAFSGRSPEYYSQDGILSGYIGQAIVGAETEAGINVYIKHFAVYDSAGIGTGCANISEQAMRENYLKPFEMIMQGEEGKDNGAHASMTSWNRIGAIWAGQNYNLQQGIARDEWGWTGFFVTDNTWQASGTCVDGLIRTGGNLPDGDLSSSSTQVLSGTWDASVARNYDSDGNLIAADDTTTKVEKTVYGAVLYNDEVSYTQWYCARMAVAQILYQEANSAGNFNGVTDTELTGSLTLTQGVAVTEEQSSIIPEKYTGGDYIILTNVTSGTLPEGLSIVDGILTGTPLSADSGEVVLQVLVDGWIPVELTLTINVTPFVNMEFDVSEKYTVGDSVDVYVMLDTSLKDQLASAYSSYTMSISEGALPEGLTMDSTGWISGTATTAGTYTFTVAVDTMDTSSKPSLNLENSYVSQMVSGGMGDDIDTIINFMNTYMSSMLGGMTLDYSTMVYLGWAYYPTTTYYMTYTMNIASTTSGQTGDDNNGSNGTDETPGTTEEATSSSSNGLAIAGLVVACVAVVAAAVGIVLVLLRKKS